MRYELEKKEHGVRGPQKSAQNEQSSGTAETIAKETGVSLATIRRDAEFAKALESMDPELKEKVLAGKSGLTRGASEERAERRQPWRDDAGRPPRLSGHDAFAGMRAGRTFLPGFEKTGRARSRSECDQAAEEKPVSRPGMDVLSDPKRSRPPPGGSSWIESPGSTVVLRSSNGWYSQAVFNFFSQGGGRGFFL